MNRRSWFLDLALKAAGLTAFCAVAPAVQAEAAPIEADMSGVEMWRRYTDEARAESRAPRRPGDTDVAMRCLECGWIGEWSNQITQEQVAREVDVFERHMQQAHADRSTVARDTVWRPHVPLTFEAMQADCAGRGCRLETYKYDPTSTLITVEHHSEQDGAVMMARGLVISSDADHLTRVESWRRSLHEPVPALTFQSDATAGQASSRLVSMEAGQIAQRVYRPRALEVQQRLAESSARAHAVVGTYIRAAGYAAPAGDVLSGGEHRVGLYVDPDLWNAVWVTNADGTRSRVRLT